MQNILTILRSEYFLDIAKKVGKHDVQLVLVTHLLEDRPEILTALEFIAPIKLVVGIPYSIHQETLSRLNKRYNIETPSLNQLYDSSYLIELIKKHLDPQKPIVFLEIGGYFAKILPRLQKEGKYKILGVVEDTENGHQAYEKVVSQLDFPVISVARSSLKRQEDFLIGVSCVYSVEHLLRQVGFPLEGKTALVLGYGKVGRGVAITLQRRNCPVLVYDTNPICCLNALSEGFHVPDREIALSQAELIFATTGQRSIHGEDFLKLKNGACLISCSSKDVEFDLTALNTQYTKTNLFKNFDRYDQGSYVLHLAAEGYPVNFIDQAVVGPLLALVQSEIILSIRQLFALQGADSGKLVEIEEQDRKQLATAWFEKFCDIKTGYYKHV